MSTNRLDSLQDLSGETIGTFEIIRPTAHRKYQTRCTKCGTIAEGVKHADLLGPHLRCFNTGCDRPKKITLLDFQNEQEAQEAAAREEAERPLKEAEAKLTKTLRDLHKVTKERITTAKDDEAFVDPATLGITMTIAQADKHNAGVVNEYRAAHPEWYPGEGNCNVKALTDYWKRNGIQILSVPIIERSVERLREYGLLECRPEPTPEPELLEEPIAPSEPQEVDDGSEWGWDEATGERTKLSAYQIKRMSADDYLRWQRIPFDQLVRPVNPVKY